jgi:phosphonate ABC transporter permease subunit PhnE
MSREIPGALSSVAAFFLGIIGIVVGGAVGLILGNAFDQLAAALIDDGSMLAAALVGAAFGALLAWATRRLDALPSGLATYYASRSLFNGIRSVEPLVMAIVFVVWVGIGPFAGSLALALHTVAALAKLYSEQVESILPGPVEAVTATGATRLQNVIYAVVPQIVPPYIAFTLYRWDINVRMSTIIGFAGGGGIGFVLQQNMNLLQYRDASLQMLAIAVVVSTLDFVSARIRERIV